MLAQIPIVYSDIYVSLISIVITIAVISGIAIIFIDFNVFVFFIFVLVIRLIKVLASEDRSCHIRVKSYLGIHKGEGFPVVIIVNQCVLLWLEGWKFLLTIVSRVGLDLVVREEW